MVGGTGTLTNGADLLQPGPLARFKASLTSDTTIVVATGASPVIPNIPGIESVRHVTSDTVWSLTDKPERLVVLGFLGEVLARLPLGGVGHKVTRVIEEKLGHHG